MRYYTVKVDKPKIYLIPFSDTHFGRKDIDEKAIRDYVDWIKRTPEAYVWLNGDLIECIPRDSPGDIYDLQLVSADAQIERVSEVFKPIRGKIIAIVSGNHENRVYDKTGVDVSRAIAKELGIQKYYDGVAVMVRLIVGKETYYVYGTHGFTLARTVGAKANSFEWMMGNVEADVYIISHSHSKLTYSRERVYPLIRPMRLQMRKKLGVMSSSWSYWYRNSYVERRQFIPPSRGTARIRLDGRRWDVHCSI